jgi:hypothetical protein
MLKHRIGRSGWFEISGGVRQGSVLSSFLFNAMTNEIAHKLEEKTRGQT